MSWTEDRVGQLRELWSQGLSASQIAERLGGITRNAVIGKAHRLALASRPSPIRATPGQTRPRARPGPMPRRSVRAPMIASLHGRFNGTANGPANAATDSKPREAGIGIDRAASHVPPPTQLAAAVDGPACKWPIGDPGDADFHFCGSPSVAARPYCPDHCAIAYIRKDRSAA